MNHSLTDDRKTTGDAGQILHVRDLTATISNSTDGESRIEKLSMVLQPGTLSTMIGPSGIGKTSLRLALIGWMRPNVRILSGDVLFGEQRLLALPLRQRQAAWGRDILYVPQSSATALVPSRRVVDQVIEFAGDNTLERLDRRKRLEEAFGRLDIPGFEENRYPHQYSGGQLQRILLATMFCSRSRLIILDEPTTALQPELKSSVMESVKLYVREAGAAALVVSHELPFFAQFSDQTIDLRAFTAPTDKRKTMGHPVSQIRPAPAIPIPSNPAPRLSVKQLCVRTSGGRRLLHDVSFEVAPGACLAIVGPSGAGKTTILRGLLGQYNDVGGVIAVDGEPMPLHHAQRVVEQKRRFEYVPQSVKRHLNPALKADYLIRRRLRQAGRDDTIDAAADMLAKVRLPADYLRKRSTELSGGECQRLGIALALTANPALLLLDEITASLDPVSAEAIAEILAERRIREGTTMLLVSHQPEIVARLATDVLELRDGRFVSAASNRPCLSTPGAQEYQDASRIVLHRVGEPCAR